MKILITGGDGFIGGHIVQKYLEYGHEVAVIDNRWVDCPDYIATMTMHGFLYYVGDIRDRQFLRHTINDFKPDIVSHHAAESSVVGSEKNPAANADVNITGSLNVIQAALHLGVNRVIFASSAAVYGATDALPIKESAPAIPTSSYGITKATIEQYLNMWQKRGELSATIFRYANVWEMSGAGQGVVSQFYRAMQDGKDCNIYGDGSATRDYIHVSDIAEANLKALDNVDGGTFNISTNTETSILQVFEAVKDALGKSDVMPVFRNARNEVGRSVLDNSAAIRELGWNPKVLLRQGAPAC